jgi:ornithine cyclodeaminase
MISNFYARIQPVLIDWKCHNDHVIGLRIGSKWIKYYADAQCLRGCRRPHFSCRRSGASLSKSTLRSPSWWVRFTLDEGVRNGDALRALRPVSYSGRDCGPAHYGARDIASLIDYATLIEQLAQAYRQSAAVPVRIRVADDSGLEMLVMPVLAERYAGAKILTIRADNADMGLPSIHGLFALFDAVGGAPLATMDAGELTGRRTAAVSALASRHLSRPDAETLLLVGSGHLVPYLAEAHATVRPIRQVRIWSRNSENAALCARRVAATLPGHDVVIADDLDEAIASADIVTSATRSDRPLIKGALLKPGTHVDAVGGYRPHMREVDDDVVLRSRIFVDTREGALAEAGDLVSPIARGVISADAILGDLPALVGGAGRAGPEDITFFKSVGSAASDLAAAELIWRLSNG